MAQPYYVPQGIAPILERGAALQAPYLAQPSGLSQALPALGNLAQTGFNVAEQNQKRMNVLQAQQVYSDYLSKVNAGMATPEDHQRGTMAALSLGLNPPQQPTTVSPDIWQSIQKEGGFQTKAPGTKENVQAGETLARLKGAGKEERQKALTEQKQKASDEKFWAQNFKLFTPTNAPRGSLVGQAAFGNARADRALTTLSDPKITPQQIRAVVNDYAGIMQGGVPHADEIKSMGFNTLLDDWANLKTRIESQPQTANQPEVVAKLKQMITEIKDVDNQIIRNNLDTFEAANSEVISRNPDKWNKIRGSVTRGTFSPEQRKATHPQDSEAVTWAKAHPNDPRAAKILELNAQ